jgi:hypothetical protein
LTGFQMLASLGLEGAPASEVMPVTVHVWFKAICRRRVFDRTADTPRIREAFAMLAERSRRWPTPADFLDALPSNVVPMDKPLRLDREKSRTAGLRALKDIAEKLKIPPPRDDEPEPPRAA